MIGAAHGFTRTLQSAIGRTKYRFFDRYHIQTIRALLITLCLVLTVATAALMAERPMFGVIAVAGIAAIGFMVFTYRHMELVALLVLVVSTVFDFGISSGTETDIKLVLLLLLVLVFLWAFRLFVVERSVEGVRGVAVIIPTLLFALAVVISFVWSMYYVVPAVRPLMYDKFMPRLVTLVVLIISPLTTILYANTMRSDRAFKFLVGWCVLAGAIMLPFSITESPLPVPELMNTGGQFVAWVGLLAVSQLLFNHKLPRYLLPILLIVAGGWLYVSVGMRFSWLSGWVPLVGGLSVVLFFRFPRLMIVVALILLAVAVVNFDQIEERFADESAESGSTRLEAGQQTIRVVRDHFLFGTGPTGYYFYLTVYIGGLFQLSHNNYIDIIAQTGVLGFAMYVWMWAATGWYVLKAYRTVPRGGFHHALAAALVGAYCVSLGVMMLGDWVTPFTYTQTLSGISYTIWHWILAGTAIALYYEARDRLQPQDAEPAAQALR